ncbi:hypothetical protein OAT67_06550 [Bacteriovoracaceae bacterium]|nr:hypothetical protein [Bacteriovoracaceae bacterium]
MINKVSASDEWQRFQSKKGARIMLLREEKFEEVVNNDFLEFTKIIKKQRAEK